MKLKFWKDHAPSKGYRGESFLASSSFWDLLAIFGVLWLIYASL